MSAITTHVLDTSLGKPATGIPIELEQFNPAGGWTRLGAGRTDADGRLSTLLPVGAPLQPGTYRLSFDTYDYFAAQGITPFYPEIRIVFSVRDTAPHYHVPLLLSPFGYTTYRGS